MKPIVFGLVGAGWRAEFALRIAQALPEQFRITGVVVRHPEKRAAVARRFQVRAVGSLDELCGAAETPQFAFVSVPAGAAATVMEDCAGRDLPVLCETPPAEDLAGLIRLHALTERGAKIQVAEQYAWQPLHRARLNVVASGRLGRVSQVQVSVAHGYHGIHLMRRFLGVDFQPARIEARVFTAPLVQGPGRDGPPARETIVADEQLMARFEFEGGGLGWFDYTFAQYFSWIRANRLLIRGERGEIENTEVRWLADFRTPLSAPLLRHDAGQGGNLEGFHHQGYTLGGEWIYRNPVAPGRLSDDEIALADCLQRMASYATGGPSFLDLRQASQDRYLELLMQRAAETGQPVTTVRQPWM